MFATFLSLAPVAFILSLIAALGVWLTAQYGLIVGGLTAGGMTTVLTVFMVWRAINKLKRALLIAIAAREMDRKLHLLVLQRVKTNLERSKTVTHRNALIEGLQKYIRDFQKEVQGGREVTKLAHETANK